MVHLNLLCWKDDNYKWAERQQVVLVAYIEGAIHEADT